MTRICVAAGALNQTPLDWDRNARHIRAAIAEARRRGVQLLCLPELCITGYGCEDAFYSPGVAQMALTVLQELLPDTEGLIVSLGLPIEYQGHRYNCACAVADGKIVGFVGKQNLAGDGLHYEPRWFRPWPNNARGELQVAGDSYPMGDLVLDCGGIRIGFEICEDAWVLNRPGEELAQQGVDVILNPSASHFAFGKHQLRQRLVLEGSRAFRASYIYANHLGNEAGRAIYDGDTLIASGGNLLTSGPRFSFGDYQVTSAVIDVSLTRVERAQSSNFPTHPRMYDQNLVRVEFAWQRPPALPRASAVPAWESSPEIKKEEFTRAEALGLFDYLRKSRSRGFVVSLSGGADSSAVSVLVAQMVHLAWHELGGTGLAEKLDHIPELRDKGAPRDLVRQLLTCVYQSTRNSSTITREAARTLAGGVGATFHELDVDNLVAGYVAAVSGVLGRELTWETDDVALQNIQARVRGPSVWLLANIQGALLLATSNRSEAAVGYATMDGDTCGGLSPIAGIDKAFLRDWLRWQEAIGPDGLGPLPELQPVNRQQPTAELRPAAAGQTDEADLMPYELLDAIERAAIRDRLGPAAAFRRLEELFPQYERWQLLEWTERFFRLWCRNQWKRERYAPSFHLDDENLDPKTWCRFPILSGGYARELRELRARLQH